MFRTRNQQSRSTTSHTHRGAFPNPFRHRDPDGVAGGFKAALTNPNTSRQNRKNVKHSLGRTGRIGGNGPHVPLMTKVKRALNIRSTFKGNRTVGPASRSSPPRRLFWQRY